MGGLVPKITYDIDLSKFEELSEETLYWIGFIAADGCIFDYESGNVGFTLALNEQDKSHLQKFQNFIKDSRPLYYSEEKHTYTLTIKRREIYDILTLYGITPAKSLTIKRPDFIQTEEQAKAWIRGYIDGDGSLAVTYPRPNYPAFEVGIVGTKDVLYFIRSYTTSTAKLYQKKGQHSWALTLQGNHQVYQFINWLYGNATIYLDRKYETFNAMNNIYQSFYKERARKTFYTEQQINEVIRMLLCTNSSMKAISEITKVSYDTIKSINNGKTHKKDNFIYPIRANKEVNFEKFIKA